MVLAHTFTGLAQPGVGQMSLLKFLFVNSGSYVWGHSNEPVKDNLWDSEQPDGGTKENCAVAINSGLHDYKCSSLFGYICEFYV